MPAFHRAQIATSTADLTEYLTFLRPLKVGQSVTLPLEAGDTSRQVMRHLNAAAGEVHLRLQRLPSDAATVRFKVLPPEKRSVQPTEEAKRARVEKARANRDARKQTPPPVSTAANQAHAPAQPGAPAVVPEEQVAQPTLRRRRHTRTRANAPAP